MKRIILIIILFCSTLYACTSKIKEGSDLTIYNRTNSDIFIIDKFSFDAEQENKPLQIFDFGYENETSLKERPYLKPEYITMYTNKTFFFSLDIYKSNYSYGALIFYIVKKENLNKSKKDLLKENLFQIIKIDLKKYNEKGSDNHIYYNDRSIEFKNY